MKAIIPCCGFGTRAGMLPNQSKEMLPDLNDEHERPLIHWHLMHCWRNGIEPLVLVRKEKEDLISYLAQKQVDVETIIMEPGKEMPETVYNAKDHWDNKNILLLPDTRFEPLNALKQVKKSLEFGCDAVFGVHEVNNLSLWGGISPGSYCEKPSYSIPGNAWGIIGFTKAAGKEIFTNLQTKNEPFYLGNFDVNFVFLEKFEDLTRKK